MKFLLLTHAAKRLNTTVEGLLGMAAKGRIVLSMRVPPDLRVGIVTSSLPNANGKIEVSQTEPLSHLDIPKEELSIPLLNKTPSRYPTYQSGYLQINQQPIDRRRLKPRAFQPDNPDSFQAIWVQVCSHHDYSPAWKHPLDEQKSGEPTPSQVKLNKATSLELINQLQNLHGQLICLKQGYMERLEPTPNTLLLSVDAFISLRKELTAWLPNDMMKDSIYFTAFMQDMNQVAREMYALAIQNQNIYPKPEVIQERLLEMPSFKDWVETIATLEKQIYADIPDTATTIIRPKTAEGKGNKKIDPTEGYLSDRFKILIAASNKFGPEFQDDIKPSIDGVTKWLLKSGIGKEIAGRAAPLIWPYQERNPGRRLGVQNSE